MDADIMNNISNFTQLGFAAVIALMLLATVRELIPKLLTVIEQNSRAMAAMAETTQQNTRTLEKVTSLLTEMDRRLLRLEDCFTAHREDRI